MKRLIIIFAGLTALSLHAAKLPPQWQVADKELADYFGRETRALSERCLNNLTTSNAWLEQLPQRRAELSEMLGLSPLPPRTDLKATVTKRFEHDTFTVENLHFQSCPGLYVTANLYVPKNLTKPAPAILYVCGHSPVVTNKVSYGTKAAYQHWGNWFARNGYVCMVIDTLESGEILGEHHGTYRAGMWWWNSRGYTPAGVECWNGMRALDYLSTRPEVDTNRFGITGRSGGGAYSWYVIAMDERIKAAAPTAGITDLENHVVDGAVEGHCDCMFFVNTYRWDYPQLAALAAPRALLICNTDDDNIFPLDGVVRLRDKVRRVYDLLSAGEKCGLVITPGPHKDTQELQVPVMRWFNKHLKGEDTLIENAATKMFSPQQLKVFDTLPGDALNARIHETFVSVSKPAVLPTDKAVWSTLVPPWRDELRAKVFGGEVEQIVDAVVTQKNASWDSTLGIRRFGMVPAKGLVPAHMEAFTETLKDSRVYARPIESFLVFTGFHTNGGFVTGSISIGNMGGAFAHPVDAPPARVVLRIVKASGESAPATPDGNNLVIQVGLTDFSDHADAKKEVQLRRRHMLLGETIHSARATDIMALLLQIRADRTHSKLPIRLEAEGDMAVNALYASLFAPVDELVLTHLPKSHSSGPDYLNVLRILDLPQAVAMASERCRVELRGANEADWQYPIQTAKNLGWEKNLRVTTE
jgi:dienelactone hydrolase